MMQKAYVRLGRSLGLAADGEGNDVPSRQYEIALRKTEKMKGFSGEIVDETFLCSVGCEIEVVKVSGGRIR
jgi:hypothetical protein